jgi:hypothetical protein
VIAGPHARSGCGVGGVGRSILVRVGPLSSPLWLVHVQSRPDNEGWAWGEDCLVVAGVVPGDWMRWASVFPTTLCRSSLELAIVSIS